MHGETAGPINSAGFEEATSSFDFEKLIDDAIKKVYRGKLAAGMADAPLFKANADTVWSAVKASLPKPSPETYGSAAHILALEMKENVNVAMAFKNHHNILELHSALIDANGKVRSFREFQTEARPLMNAYNVNYLKAEYEYAVAAGQQAVAWSRLSEADLISYSTVGDNRVRQEHALLDGTTLPPSDPFWDTYYPPNGWRCRCKTIAKDGDATIKQPEGLPDLQPFFRNNVGKTAKVFPESHPYFNIEPRFAKSASIDLFGLAKFLEPSQELLARRIAFKNRYSLDNNFQLVEPEYWKAKNQWEKEYSGSLFIHKQIEPSDITGTIPVAHLAAAEGRIVVLLPTKASIGKKGPTADGLMDNDGLDWEFKGVTGGEGQISKAASAAEEKSTALFLYTGDKFTLKRVREILRGYYLLTKKGKGFIRTKVVAFYAHGAIHYADPEDLIL